MAQPNQRAAAMTNEDKLVVYSRYCSVMEDDGISVELIISRDARHQDWSLEVVNSAGKSFLWPDTFPSEEAAFSEFSRTVQQKGMLHFHSFETTMPSVQENRTLH